MVELNNGSSVGWREFWQEYFECPKCHNLIAIEAKFCANCGDRIEWKIDPADKGLR